MLTKLLGTLIGLQTLILDVMYNFIHLRSVLGRGWLTRRLNSSQATGNGGNNNMRPTKKYFIKPVQIHVAFDLLRAALRFYMYIPYIQAIQPHTTSIKQKERDLISGLLCTSPDPLFDIPDPLFDIPDTLYNYVQFMNLHNS